MEQQKEKKYYTSDRINLNATAGLERRIKQLDRLKSDLIAYRGEGESDINKKIDELLQIIDVDLEYCKEELNEFLPNGVYVLRQDYAQFKRGTKIQRKTDKNTCDDCIFSKIPCLNINALYGCNRRKSDKNVTTENGELIREGYFILYEDKNEN